MKVLMFVHPSSLHRRVVKALEAAQMPTHMVGSRQDCLRAAESVQYKGFLIDSDALIFINAVALVQELRHGHAEASIFVLSRSLDLAQRLSLFEAGVDDCVCEPFIASELAVRLGLSIRLRQAASPQLLSNTVNLLRHGDLELDLVRRRAARLGKPIDLRPKEFLLLEYLVRNVNRPVTRTMILEHVWNSSFEGPSNVVDVHVSALRRKVDHGFHQKLIRTDRCIGYTFTCETEVADMPRVSHGQPVEETCAQRSSCSSDIGSGR
jgi:two-component system, OmpR family, response regulator